MSTSPSFFSSGFALLELLPALAALAALSAVIACRSLSSLASSCSFFFTRPTLSRFFSSGEAQSNKSNVFENAHLRVSFTLLADVPAHSFAPL